MTVKRERRAQPYRPSLYNAAKTVARQAIKTGIKQYLKPSSTNTGGAVLTGQFDYKTDYRKRRLTPRKRKFIRRRARFNRRIINVVRNANTGAVHLVRNSLYKLTSGNNVSNIVCYGLNSLDGFGTGDANDTCNDIGEFLREKNPAGWAAWDVVGNTTPPYKMYVMHGSMEMTLRNVGAYDAIIEAYYIRGRRPVRNTVSSDTPGNVYKAGFIKQPTAQDPDTGNLYDGPLAFDTLGTTPFQSSLFCRHYRIYKRTKFRLPPGNEISMAIHVRGNVFNVPGVKGYTTDRRFHGIFFQQQGSPIVDVTNFKAAPAEVLYFSVRRYRAKFVENNIVSDAFEVTDP